MRILVAGVGNVLKGDDGFGVRAIEMIMSEGDLPDGVTTIETGIGGIHLVQELSVGYDALILIDAMDRRGVPGELFLVEPVLPDLTTMTDRERRDFFADMHYATPVRALTLAREINALPPIVRIIGCQPHDAETFGATLSPAVTSAVQRAASMVVEQCRSLSDSDPHFPTAM